MIKIPKWLVGAVGALAVALFAYKAYALANPITKGRAWTVTCPATALGISLAPASGFKPTGAFKIKVPAGGSTVYIGNPADVNATTTGYPIDAGESEAIDSSPTLWSCITAGGSQAVEIIGGS